MAYDNDKRLQQSQLLAALHTEVDADRLDEQLEKSFERTMIRRTKQERRAEARRKALPADRICPTCHFLVFESRRWVVQDGQAQCLSCYRRSRDGT